MGMYKQKEKPSQSIEEWDATSKYNVKRSKCNNLAS